MIYRRQYVQFNDLVFDNVVSDDSSTSFKYDDTDRPYTHGAYSPTLQNWMLVDVGDASMTIKLKMKRLPCEARPFYRDFAIAQLSQPGMLWAVQNNTLVWAFAKPVRIDELSDSRNNQLEIDLDFKLPEGVWHKADMQKAFLKPWDVCEFMECYDFKELKPCVPLDGTSCCDCGENHPVGCRCCDCEELAQDMALCYHTEELQNFYSCNGAGVRIVYSCEGANRYFSDDVGTNYQGQKLCGDCGLIAGTLYSNTDIPTTDITIRFSGEVSNPYIEINGNGNQIKGDYENLTIYPDGTATYGCDGCKEINVENWSIPSGMEYGWVVHQGNNRVVIDTGNCCGNVCAYFMVDALTV